MNSIIIAMGVFTPFCISVPFSHKSAHLVCDSNEKMCNMTAESMTAESMTAESTFVHDISDYVPPLKRARLSIDTPFDKPFVMPNFENLVIVPIKQYNFGPYFYRDLYVEKKEEDEENIDEIIHQLGLLVNDEEVVENDWGIIPLRLEDVFDEEEEAEDMAMDIEEEEEEPDYKRCIIA
jgi:hypothetical protein